MKHSTVPSRDDFAERSDRGETFRAVRIVRKGRLAVAEPVEPSEPLTPEIVCRTQAALRAERSKV
jgi:hypothetical protein